MTETRFAVIGGGAWGTALAIHLGSDETGRPAGRDRSVGLWVREPEIVAAIDERRENATFLPGVRIPDTVRADTRLDAVLAGATLVLAVVPSHHARSVYREMAPWIAADVPVVVATKGIEDGTLALPLEVAAATLGTERGLAVLSGPSFAAELARGLTTAVVVAADDAGLVGDIQARLSSPVLRVYAGEDPRGVQIAGALKNVIAIAAGVADALGMGANAQAALITRGLAEIGRLGLALGCRPETFAGLAGLGDLVLTCTGSLSRNRQLGQRIGRGERLADILASTEAVAEGVRTTRSARQLAIRAGVEMPIVEELNRMLFEGGAPREALARLMGRPLTAERG